MNDNAKADLIPAVTVSSGEKFVTPAGVHAIKDGIKKAKEKGATTIMLTGKKQQQPNTNCDLTIKAPGETTAEIQETHLIIYHTLCYLVEKELVKKKFINYRP